MTKRFKTAFASLAVATLTVLGASSQASAFDLLEELLGGAKYADSCGCSQKSGGHVQKRCGSACGGKGGHVQRSGLGHVQNSASKGGKCGGHAQRSCGDSKGKSIGGHAQRSHGKSLGGHAQHGDIKAGTKGGKGKKSDMFASMRSKMAHMKCKLSSLHMGGKGKGKGKGDDGDLRIDGKIESYGAPLIVPAPIIREDLRSVPVPADPDPTT